jgi:hypothetical protein
MGALKQYFQLGLDALFLKPEVYEKMRDDADALKRGVIFILLVGSIVAALAVVGTALEAGTSPNLNTIRDVVLEELRKLPFYQDLQNDPQALLTFNQIYSGIWQGITPLVEANILSALGAIIITPLTLLVQWLVYGLLIFLSSRLFGGKGSFKQNLSTLALAVAPQMLNAFMVLPYVAVGGLFVWSMACSFRAVRAANQFSGWRAFWVTLTPLIVLTVLLVLSGVVIVPLLIFVISQIGGGL